MTILDSDITKKKYIRLQQLNNDIDIMKELFKQKNSKTCERIFYYDFLRSIAIIAVILVHMRAFFNFPSESMQNIMSIIVAIGHIGVPIFFMISGALLLNKDYNLKTFLKKRFSRIIYPFIFWIIIIEIGIYYFNGSPTDMWNTFFGVHTTIWFFWTLIGIYLFMPIINSFLKEYGLKGTEYFLIIWFFTMILKTFNIYPLGGGTFDLLYFSGYLGYPILGYYLDNIDFKTSNSRICASGLIIFLISLTIYVYLAYTGTTLKILGYNDFIIVFAVSGLFLFIKYFDGLNHHLKDKIIGRIIVSISICSYGMYYAHIIVIKPFLLINPNPKLLSILYFILIIFFSWLMTYILSKIPFLKKFSGA